MGSVVVLVLVMVSFSSFVSTLAASITHLSDLRKNEMRQFWLLRRYLKDKKIPRQLALRVQRYVEYSYAKQQKCVQERDVTLLTLLSEPLREEVKAETLGPGVSVHPLFEQLHERLRGFSKALEALNIAHGDLVFSYGEEAMEMYFVTTGQLQYERGRLVETHDCDDDDDLWYEQKDDRSTVTIQEELMRGEWACEQPLWTMWSHRGFLSATNDCTLIAVSSIQFSAVIEGCRPTWEGVRKYAETFVEQLNSLGSENCSDLLSRNFSHRASDAIEAHKAPKIRHNNTRVRGERLNSRYSNRHKKMSHAMSRGEKMELWWFRYVKSRFLFLDRKRDADDVPE